MNTYMKKGRDLEPGDLVLDSNGPSQHHWVRLLYQTDIRTSMPDASDTLREWQVEDACPCAGVEHPQTGGYMAWDLDEDVECVWTLMPLRLISFLDLERAA